MNYYLNQVQTYIKAWDKFCLFCEEKYKVDARKVPGASENHFVEYFEYLRTVKEYQGNTIWTAYSYLNTMYKKEFGRRIGDLYPGIVLQLKQYSTGETVYSLMIPIISINRKGKEIVYLQIRRTPKILDERT